MDRIGYMSSNADPGARNPSRFFRGASRYSKTAPRSSRRFANCLILRYDLAHPARFELTTSAFGGQRSIQLSYGCLRSPRDQEAGYRQAGRHASRFDPGGGHRTNACLQQSRPKIAHFIWQTLEQWQGRSERSPAARTIKSTLRRYFAADSLYFRNDRPPPQLLVGRGGPPVEAARWAPNKGQVLRA